ncbi:MAG: terpene cyclase/mutase family protein [Planctomycetes bacterium]|nr:terpene cyclase/mutase family protein [Planctomycetota bacterium]
MRPLSLLPPLAAVLAGAVPAQDTLRERVNHALAEARPALLAHLQEATESAGRPGELALVLLAAIHDGVDANEPRFPKAVQRLAKAKPSETYDLALRLMVMEALPTFPDREDQAKDDAKQLLRHRHREGGFGYDDNPGSWDLSNTQYAVLGLRAAKALGVKVERVVWSQLVATMLDNQDAYGGFGYGRNDSGFDSYASMTAAGVAVLAICRQMLDDGGRPPQALDGRIQRGWQWFTRNPDTIGSAKERWSFYFHYGLERAAILCDVDKVGTIDWYAEGARMLCDLQDKGGGWSSLTDGYPGGHLARGRGDLVPTSFAVLFLRRKFQKVVGAVTPHVVRLVNLGPNSKPADVEACAADLVKRGKEALPEVFQALRSDHEPVRRAAAQALRGIAGEPFGYDPALSAADNRAAITRAELWYLKNR